MQHRVPASTVVALYHLGDSVHPIVQEQQSGHLRFGSQITAGVAVDALVYVHDEILLIGVNVFQKLGKAHHTAVVLVFVAGRGVPV